ncbi:ribosome maturation factor RimM [Buchnera aphidicola (Formosaphis micheliae)]|uniref:ribosome maturation factor RimM n=1 Tax=Buchnera aphidicola TaxID=9 RepID=UPI0031B7FABA
MTITYINKPIYPCIIGKLGATYGILGWIKLFSFTSQKNNILKYSPLLINYNYKWITLNIENKKYHKNFILIKIKNIDDQNQAKKLTNSYIVIEKNMLPKLKSNEYYWNDIINCNVISINNDYIGKVIKIIQTGSNDILIIKQKKTKKEILIPFLYQSVIKKIDIIHQLIIVNWNNIYK